MLHWSLEVDIEFLFLSWMCMKEKTFLFQCCVVKCGQFVVWTHLALHHFITTKHLQPCCKVCAKPFCWIWVVVLTIIFQLVFGIAYGMFSKWLFPTMETIMVVLDGNLHTIWSPFFIQMKIITKNYWIYSYKKNLNVKCTTSQVRCIIFLVYGAFDVDEIMNNYWYIKMLIWYLTNRVGDYLISHFDWKIVNHLNDWIST